MSGVRFSELCSRPCRHGSSSRSAQISSIQRNAGGDRERIADFVGELQAKGCQALAYRLTGDTPLDHLCVRHLGRLRVIVAFADTATAWVLLIGPHEETDPGMDIYTELYRLAGFDAPPADKRTKPPCCDESGVPPALNDLAQDLADRATMLRRTRR